MHTTPAFTRDPEIHSGAAVFPGTRVPISILSTPPTTTVTLSPPPNAAGWNRTDVILLLNATDTADGTGVKNLTYSATGAQVLPSTTIAGSTAALVVSSEGATILTYFATDQAGNQEQPRTLIVRIDKTPPVVAFAGNQATYTADQQVTITCTASDPPGANGTPGSGLASTTCQTVNAPAANFKPGLNTLSATATDVAGNIASASTSFTVQVTYASLCNLSHAFVSNLTLANGMCTTLNAAQRNEQLGAPQGKTGELDALVQLTDAALSAAAWIRRTPHVGQATPGRRRQ